MVYSSIKKGIKTLSDARTFVNNNSSISIKVFNRDLSESFWIFSENKPTLIFIYQIMDDGLNELIVSNAEYIGFINEINGYYS
jgi:hypothetical protein